MLQINNLSVRYPQQDWLFKDVSLILNKGETLWLKGTNGSGKTSLLYAVANVIPLMIEAERTGEVFLDNDLLNDVPLNNLIPELSLMLCNPYWDLFFTYPEDEIVFALENIGLSVSEIDGRLKSVSEEFGLGEWLKFPTHKLSAGWQKMVVLAVHAAIRPKILLLDEPLNGLSPANIATVMNWLAGYSREGGILIIAEHSPLITKLIPAILNLDE